MSTKFVTVRKSDRKRTFMDRLLGSDWHDVLMDGHLLDTYPTRASALYWAGDRLEHDVRCQDGSWSLKDETAAA